MIDKHIEQGLKLIMEYSNGPQKVCQNCTYINYSDDNGYTCGFNRAAEFNVVPLATCKHFFQKTIAINIGTS